MIRGLGQLAVRGRDAWRAGNPEERFWQILSHQLAVRIPEIGRQRAAAKQPALARR